MQDPHDSAMEPSPKVSTEAPAVQPASSPVDPEAARRNALRATREAIRPYPAASGVDNGQGIADQQRSALAPGTARRGRKPKASPSIFRDAARALIKPKSGPKPGDKIAFGRDDTPADAEQILDAGADPDRPKPHVKPGPLPRTAPVEAQHRRAKAREIRAEITPLGDVPRPANAASAASAPPQLSDAEIQQMIEWTVQRYGSILNISEAAEVSKLAKQTIRQRVCEGRYADSVIRGRPLRFMTHRFVAAVLEDAKS